MIVAQRQPALMHPRAIEPVDLHYLRILARHGLQLGLYSQKTGDVEVHAMQTDIATSACLLLPLLGMVRGSDTVAPQTHVFTATGQYPVTSQVAFGPQWRDHVDACLHCCPEHI